MKTAFFRQACLTVFLVLGIIMPVSYAADMPQTPAVTTTAPAETIAPAETTAPVTTTVPAAATTPAETTASTTTDATTAAATDTEKKAEENSDRKIVAHVVWVKGTFYATVPGSEEKRTLKPSSNIFMNDTLITGTGSEAEIVFSDNTLMTFRAASKFYINQYNYAPKGKAKTEDKSVGTYIMDLIEGGFRTITGVIAKENPDNYQVNTPVATIGVRGTEYSVVYTKDGQLYVKRYKGVPCVTNPNAKEKKEAVCLNKKDKYAEVADASGNPEVVAKEPNVFDVDVEVIPVLYADNSVGFCPLAGCGSGEGDGGSGFCIQ